MSSLQSNTKITQHVLAATVSDSSESAERQLYKCRAANVTFGH